MAYFLGVDTGGTYTDAVILDEAADTVMGSAKSLTTRGDLALGIGRAVDAALAGAGIAPGQVSLEAGQPLVELASGGVSDTSSPGSAQPPNKSLQLPKRANTPRARRDHVARFAAERGRWADRRPQVA